VSAAAIITIFSIVVGLSGWSIVAMGREARR
jgi:hypothetical protein